MTVFFNPYGHVIIVPADVTGPSGLVTARLALDTAATRTIISPAVLAAAGYQLAAPGKTARMTTGSSTSTATLLPVTSVKALGREMKGLLIVAHALPLAAGVQGLL